MKFFNACVISSVLLSLAGPAAAENWRLNAKSKIGFDIRSAGMSIVNGQFHSYQAQMNLDPAQPQSASMKFVMDVNSLSFSKPSLKDMILGDSFFNAARYKTTSFQSTQVKSLGNHKYAIHGQLTLRGVSKPVTFDTTLTPVPGQSKALKVISATTINRSDFGMPKAMVGIGEKVTIKLDGQWQAQ